MATIQHARSRVMDVARGRGRYKPPMRCIIIATCCYQHDSCKCALQREGPDVWEAGFGSLYWMEGVTFRLQVRSQGGWQHTRKCSE